MKYRVLRPACPYCGAKRTAQDAAPYCTATCHFLDHVGEDVAAKLPPSIITDKKGPKA